MSGHDVLATRHRLAAKLVCTTALHVGAGEGGATLAATDMTVARDGSGRPYIPGSSLRGALRAGLEALLRGLPQRGLRVCDPLDKEKSCSHDVQEARAALKPAELTEAKAFELAWDGACAVCRLFGHSFLASRVRIADLTVIAKAAEVYVRDGVGIDRDLRTAAKGILYSFEAVAADTAFDLRIDLDNAEDHELGLILTGLDLFSNGTLRLGGKASRGLGQVEIEGTTLERHTASDLFEGRAAAPVDDLKALRLAAAAYYAQGGIGECSASSTT